MARGGDGAGEEVEEAVEEPEEEPGEPEEPEEVSVRRPAPPLRPRSSFDAFIPPRSSSSSFLLFPCFYPLSLSVGNFRI